MKKSILSLALLISLILAVTVSTVCCEDPSQLSMSNQLVAAEEDASAPASSENNSVHFPTANNFDCSELLNSNYTYGTGSNFEVNFESDNPTFDFSSILSSGHTGSASGRASGSNGSSSSLSLSSRLNPEYKVTEPDYSDSQMLSDSKSVLDYSNLSTIGGIDRSYNEPSFKEGVYCGYLSIPDVGYYNNLYYTDASKPGNLGQQIVDNEDSAAYIKDSVEGFTIADHASQGFDAMKKAIPYETYAYINFGSYTQTYICIAIGNGKNISTDLIDWNGNSICYDSIPGGLAMYTCNDETGVSITISYWQPV